MLDKDKEVQGVAVYAEFARENATTQVIVTPDGYANDGLEVGATIIRRTITATTPKKQWKFSQLAFSGSQEFNTKDEYVEYRMRYATVLFDQLSRGDWKLVKKPILIEISKKDYDSIKLRKTPTKIMYRISQSRSALDFPAELINTSN